VFGVLVEALVSRSQKINNTLKITVQALISRGQAIATTIKLSVKALVSNSNLNEINTWTEQQENESLYDTTDIFDDIPVDYNEENDGVPVDYNESGPNTPEDYVEPNDALGDATIPDPNYNN